VSSALMEAPGLLFAAAPAGGRRPTLEELLEGRWRTAHAEGQAECPVCQAAMRVEGDHARCSGCGTTLY
jgi:uncharacterized paraquat-inducible protein A